MSKDSDKMEENANNIRIVKPIQCKEVNDFSPQFVVTLDGIDHNKYLQNSELEDRIVLDEEMDEELLEPNDAPNDSIDEDMNDNDLSLKKVNERCRYWPTCKNGDSCEFHHPISMCKTFPNCRFGDKCLYIHPNCKFDAMCSRRDCPFTHASKRKIPISPVIVSNLLPPSSSKPCKYLPNCKNPACPYFHPKICHFGSKCRSYNCPFIHPNLNYNSMTSVPHPHQLKWKAKDHISDRVFAVSGSPNESKMS